MKSRNSKSQKSLESDKSEAKHHCCRGTEPFSTNSGGEKRLNICSNGGFKRTVCSCELNLLIEYGAKKRERKSPSMKMLVLSVVTEFYQNGLLTDFKAVFARSEFLPSD